VVVMLFVNAFLRWDLAAFIASMFILSMLTLCGALLAFLIEVRIATSTLRIGIEAAAHENKDHEKKNREKKNHGKKN